MRIFILLIVIAFFFNCNSKKSKEKLDKESLTEKSFKQKIQKNEDLKSQIIFDEEKNIYTNLEYGITVNFPDNWETDMGTTQNSLIRGFEKDSGITMIIIPIELKKNTKIYNHQKQLISFYEKKKDDFDSFNLRLMEEMTGRKISNYKSKKSYIRNQPTIQSKFTTIMRHLDYEYEMTTINHQFWKDPYSYTISLSLPSTFYKDNQEEYNWLFTNISFTK